MNNNKVNFEGMTMEELEAMANQNNAEAIMELARRYLFGYGVEHSSEKYFKLLKRAAELGYLPAQVTLGSEYKYQFKKYEDAVKWYKIAAEKGYASAQNCLARCYLQGNGVEQNPEEAIRLFKASAEQDNYLACRELYRCFEEGIGVEKDPQEAAKWNKKAEELKAKSDNGQ